MDRYIPPSKRIQALPANPSTNTPNKTISTSSQYSHVKRIKHKNLRRLKGNTLARLNYQIKQNIIYNKYLNKTLATSSTQHPNGKTIHNEDESPLETNTKSLTQYTIGRKVNKNDNGSKIFPQKRTYQIPQIHKYAQFKNEDKYGKISPSKTITKDINHSNNETTHNTLPSDTIFKTIVDGETRGTYKKGTNLIKKNSEALSGQKMLSPQIYSSKRYSKNGNEASPCSDMTPQTSCSGLSASKSILNADKLSLGGNGNTDENINGNALVLPTLQLYSMELINLITNQSLMNIYLMYALISGVILTILDTG